MTPEAVAIIQRGAQHDEDDGAPENAEQRDTVPHGILGPMNEAFQPKTTDPRHIDAVISQTRAMLDAPEAEALRRNMRRQQALEAREIEKAARDAARVAAIDQRNAELLAEIAAAKAAASQPSSPSAVANDLSTAGATQRSSSSATNKASIDASSLAVPVVIDEMDAFTRLRVEEARQRLEAARRKANGGNSIVATYMAEDVALDGDAVAAKATNLVQYTPETTGLSQRMALKRAAALASPITPPNASSTVGFRHVDETAAEERARAKAAERLRALNASQAAVAAQVQAVRDAEALERNEASLRYRHENMERQRALRASSALRRQPARGTTSTTAHHQSFSATLPTEASMLNGSLHRAGASRSKSFVPSAVADGEQETLRANLWRQDRAEHPIDAYQRRVRADLLADRGYDQESIAMLEAEMSGDTSLLRLAEAHDRYSSSGNRNQS